jgi:hypothetical protein
LTERLAGRLRGSIGDAGRSLIGLASVASLAATVTKSQLFDRVYDGRRPYPARHGGVMQQHIIRQGSTLSGLAIHAVIGERHARIA